SDVPFLCAFSDGDPITGAMGPILQRTMPGAAGREHPTITGAGLWAGVDVDPGLAGGREVCERMVRAGVLVKDTHGSTIRLSPPLVVQPEEIGFAVDTLGKVLAELR
ncbi:ornithine--oxo-acid transaminase, partial [Pseudonocardia sp. K10HN5]|nr:ornithine--oxo-acid transaminase [Pseudonocardia acidicola]